MSSDPDSAPGDAETFEVAAIQMDVRLGDRERNLERVAEFAREASAGGARLLVFPECVVTGYCFESREEAAALAEPVPGPSTERVGELARELDVTIVFGLIESSGEHLFNALAMVSPAGLVAGYRKIHLPWLGLDRFVTPGDRPFAVHELPFCRVGMNICYDGSFPESARVMALAGADVIVLPTNWPPM